MNPTGFCLCGCGGRTKLSTRSDPRRGVLVGQHVHYLYGHNPRPRGALSPIWRGGKRQMGDGYVGVYMPGHPRALGRYVAEHVYLATRALGKPLPLGAEVHHVNGNKSDNRPENLVVCQDKAYHRLIEMRTRALEACGHADWRKCALCGKYDAPENMYVYPSRSTAHHRTCGAKSVASYKRKRQAILEQVAQARRLAVVK